MTVEIAVCMLAQAFLSLNIGTRTGKLHKLVRDNLLAFERMQVFISPEVVSGMTNKTAIYRLAQAIAFVASGNFKLLDAVTAALTSHVMLNEPGKRVAFIDVHYALSGAGKETYQDAKALPGINSAKLRKVVGSVKPSTVTSQASRTVGEKGFFTVLGITRKSDKNGFEIADKMHGFIVAYALTLSKLPEGDLVRALVKDETENDQ